ncbi:MAG TPA: hypothetical protein DCS66_05480, partial [Flavobacteriaceae bacterium]|nr:hypothetical protein [Flavobacteriaceae bacterium]
ANYFMPGIGGEIAGPWARGLASAGAGALTGAVTGRGDRGLNAIKGAMLGVGGGGLTQAATSMAGSVPFMGGTAQTAMGFGEALKGAAIPLGIGLGGAMINQVPQGQGPTFGSPTRPLTPEERKKLAYKGITGGESGPVFSPPQGYSPGFTPRWTANEGGLSPELGISDDQLREMNPNVLTNIAKDLMADPNRTEEQVTKLRNILKRFFDLQTGHGHLDESMGGDIDPGLSGIEQVKVLSKSDEVLDILKSPAYKALSENEQKKLQEHIREDYNFEPLSIAQGGEIPEQENLRPGSFVLTSDVVSDIGDGNTNSGFDRLDNLFGGGLAEVENYALGGGIHGPTGGLDDLRQTTIGGSQAAALSDGEYVLSPRAVKEVGKQVLNNTQATPSQMQKAGAEQLYSFMKNIRLAKHGTPNQPKQQITTGGLRNALA